MRVDSIITVQKDELTKRQWAKLFDKLTFYDNDETEISSYQYIPGSDTVLMPRGAWSLIPKKVEVHDLRSCPKMPRLKFAQKLDGPGYEGQQAAVDAMFEFEQGQVIAPPGTGKTQIGMAFAAACQTRVLVVVHTQDLFKQWIDRAKPTVPDMPIGRIQGQTCQVEHLTVATAQTLKKHLDDGGKFWRQFGAVIVDEAHHAAAETWEWLLNTCPAYYRFGLTASEKRSDGRQQLVKHNIGPVIYKIKFKSQVPMRIEPIQTRFKTKWNGTQYSRVLKELVNDEDRNRLIGDLVASEIREGNSVLVLSRQIKHLELIHDSLPEELQDQAKVVTGKLPRQWRDEVIADLRDGSLRCILGTQLFEEGIDVPRLNRIVLAFPGTEITALQKIGRGSRKFPDKYECVVYDLLDDLVRVLAKQYLRRKAWYQSVKIDIERVRPYGKPRKDEVGRTEKKKGRLAHRLYQVARPNR